MVHESSHYKIMHINSHIVVYILMYLINNFVRLGLAYSWGGVASYVEVWAILCYICG